MPLTFNERTGQSLPVEMNRMQESLTSLEEFTSKKLLKIKEKKTNLMKFNFSRSHDFPPELEIKGFDNQLEIIKETKLLGVILTDDLKWSKNTEYICKRAYKQMWTLRRMKVLDVDPYIILDVYIKEIRSLLELAVPAWHSGLTVKQSGDIERVQKVALYIILSDTTTGNCEFSYDMALALLAIDPLQERRDTLCLSFANKTLKSRNIGLFPNTHQCYARNDPDYYYY